MINRNLIKLLIFLFAAGLCFIFFKSVYTTYRGEVKENFSTYNAKVLPSVLRMYLRNHNYRFVIYKTPNYVKNLLKYNHDFDVVYKSNKHSIIMFKNYAPNEVNNFYSFYDEIGKYKKEYLKYFNFLERPEIEYSEYKLKDDTRAYKDLRDRCRWFCIIDSELNTIFTIKNQKGSELELILVLLQQYSQNPKLYLEQ